MTGHRERLRGAPGQRGVPCAPSEMPRGDGAPLSCTAASSAPCSLAPSWWFRSRAGRLASSLAAVPSRLVSAPPGAALQRSRSCPGHGLSSPGPIGRSIPLRCLFHLVGVEKIPCWENEYKQAKNGNQCQSTPEKPPTVPHPSGANPAPIRAPVPAWENLLQRISSCMEGVRPGPSSQCCFPVAYPACMG